MNPDDLIRLLAELERLRQLSLNLIEQNAPELHPDPPQCPGPQQTMYELLVDVRRAVLGSPAAARSLHDLLAHAGDRYARTPDGHHLRDALAASDAVENLRRVWETVSLNVLDGPAAPGSPPHAWAELMTDIVLGHGIDDATKSRVRPEGLA